jgi:hypothetical protein
MYLCMRAPVCVHLAACVHEQQHLGRHEEAVAEGAGDGRAGSGRLLLLEIKLCDPHLVLSGNGLDGSVNRVPDGKWRPEHNWDVFSVEIIDTADLLKNERVF